MVRPELASVEEYGARFTDARYWRPYVEAVIDRHGLGPVGQVQAGLPGTNPVFLVDGRYAVKFYTDLFAGATSIAIERELYALVASTSNFPAPALVTHGNLFEAGDGWPWPYIVTSVVPGTSLREAGDRIAYADRVALARFLGGLLRRLHSLPLASLLYLKPTWDDFRWFLKEQREACVTNHARWQTLPPHLVAQLDDYLPAVSALVDWNRPPAVLHCDLNADHVLGDPTDDGWRPAGIIDFGDAKVGDRVYELVALHTGLFGCDKGMLSTFLEDYGFDTVLADRFVQRAMSFTLLHEFNVLDEVCGPFPQAREVGTLEELAELLWNIETAGLPANQGGDSHG